MMNELDAHGQPLNPAFNAARRRVRDVSEMLGLAKGMLADGIVSEDEVRYLRGWFDNHPDALTYWPCDVIHRRLEQIFADGHVEEEERTELREMLAELVGGQSSIVLGYEGATALPLDAPPPLMYWENEVYVFTGRFAYGTRTHCESEVVVRGGACTDNITQRTTFLVIGTFGSLDWAHSSYGRKIEKAVKYRHSGFPLRIVGEDHWARAL